VRWGGGELQQLLITYWRAVATAFPPCPLAQLPSNLLLTISSTFCRDVPVSLPISLFFLLLATEERPLHYDQEDESTSLREQGGGTSNKGEDDDDDDDDDIVASIFIQSMKTNLLGPFYLTRAVLPHMVRNKYGRCVYVASTAATNVGSEASAVGYNTSKSGLLGLMHSTMQDGAKHGITSNAVLLGWVRTEMAERHAEAEAKRRNMSVERIWDERAALYPSNRVVEPVEVAHAILWLSSVESSGVSGESIRVSLGCPY